MKNYFEIKSKKAFHLKKISTRLEPRYKSAKDYEGELEKYRSQIEESQTLLYANHSRALLIIFQGMDTAGKDGAVKHVMAGVNPQGCSVISFKTPNFQELSHDFLWRVNRVLPERGLIGIFNRSYYEEVLVPKVHPELLNNERLPNPQLRDPHFWKHRYQDINHYESYLNRQGYDLLKIFIHISKKEQKSRLLERFADPRKHWKISEGDVNERAYWNEYQEAYQKCIAHTSTKSNPWYIVPGDDKDNARLNIAEILVARLSKMKLTYPRLNSEEKKNLKKLQLILEKE